LHFPTFFFGSGKIVHMNWLNLIGTACAFGLFSLKEGGRVRRRYYANNRFKSADKALKRRYLWQNPYAICRRFLAAKGYRDVHSYGETPLTSLEQIARICSLTKEDVFLDLGCGRGRGVFFLHHLFGCPAIGIDWVPRFIEKAKEVAEATRSPVEFICGNMVHCNAELSRATVIYLAWTCLEEEDRSRIEEALRNSRPGTRIVTVSYPFTSKDFTAKEASVISFPWGEAEVFFHERK